MYQEACATGQRQPDRLVFLLLTRYLIEKLRCDYVFRMLHQTFSEKKLISSWGVASTPEFYLKIDDPLGFTYHKHIWGDRSMGQRRNAHWTWNSESANRHFLWQGKPVGEYLLRKPDFFHYQRLLKLFYAWNVDSRFHGKTRFYWTRWDHKRNC